MKMIEIRRTYAVGLELAKRVDAEAKRRGWDKSQVVQLALRLALPQIEAAAVRGSVEIAEEQLRGGQSESISSPSVKRRSK
jgi:hypothetical protein